MKRNFILILIIFYIVTACTKKEVPCSVESFAIVKNYNGFGRSDAELFAKFNLCDSLLKSDTIHMSFYGWTHSNISNHYISYNLPHKYTLKEIERISKFSATIWNDEFQALILNDINYKTKRSLPFYDPKTFKRNVSKSHPQAPDDEINRIEDDFDVFVNSKNIIYYPWLKINNTIKDRFKNIERDELISSIENKFREDRFSSKDEMDSWKSLTRKYQKGDFLKDSEIFQIDLEEVFIKLKIQKDGEDIEKILKYSITIGN